MRNSPLQSLPGRNVGEIYLVGKLPYVRNGGRERKGGKDGRQKLKKNYSFPTPSIQNPKLYNVLKN